MLSKVAERVYWSTRYLERIESTARLITIYNQLLFDLPKTVNLSWYNLIRINILEDIFSKRYSVMEERNVLAFMIGDSDNPSSIVTSLTALRENIRTTREVIPSDAWEMTNELNIYLQEHMRSGVNRRSRHQFLEHLIHSCQQIIGLYYCNMSRDVAWRFVELGMYLERADMTSRNLDAGLAAALEISDDDQMVNSRQIIWGNVLRSLNAMESYRRTLRSSVSEADAMDFLLHNAEFPRAIAFCVAQLTDAADALPHSADVVKQLRTIQQQPLLASEEDSLGDPQRDQLNQLQIQLAQTHNVIADSWFPALA